MQRRPTISTENQNTASDLSRETDISALLVTIHQKIEISALLVLELLPRAWLKYSQNNNNNEANLWPAFFYSFRV